MNRLITSLVQALIGIPALYMGRMMYHELKAELKEMRNK